MKHFYPKSQAMQVGSLLIWGLSILAIRQGIGLDWESGGLALASLLGLLVAVYLTSGKRLDLDVGRGQVGVVWRLAAVPLWRSSRKIMAEQVELRPESMMGSDAVERNVVYDLVLVGREETAAEPISEDTALDLKEDQILFTLAERRARAVAEAMDLPVAVRWDRIHDDVPCDRRERGQWSQPFAYPESLGDWRKWFK